MRRVISVLRTTSAWVMGGRAISQLGKAVDKEVGRSIRPGRLITNLMSNRYAQLGEVPKCHQANDQQTGW